MDHPYPEPDPLRCPVCGASLGSARCTACGAQLGGPAGQELWAVDNDLYRLSWRREELIRQVRAAAPPGERTTAGLGPPPAVLPPPPGRPDDRPLPPMLAPGAPPAAAGRPPGMEVSSILLGLGVALLVVAALVFAVVSWDRLGAVGQGALLVGLTAAAGAATHLAARRHLTGTAEAFGVLTVVLGPLLAQAVRITVDLPAIDDRTWGNWTVWSWWPIALVVIGAAAIAFGRIVGVRSPQYIGVVVVQVGPAIWVALAPVSPSVVAGGLALQAALVATVPAFAERDRPSGTLWAWGAALTWTFALSVALGEATSSDLSVTGRVGATVAFAACAVAAGGVAQRWRERAAWADLATGAAAVAGFLAAGRGFAGAVPDAAWWPILGVVAAGGLAVADGVRGIRAGALRGVSWAVAGLAGLPVLGNGVAVAIAAGSTGEPWHTRAGGHVAVDALGRLDPPWASALAGVAALAAAVVADRRRLGRRTVISAAVVLVALGAVLVPPLAGAPLAVVTVAALAAAVGLAAVAWSAAEQRWVAAVALAVVGLGLVWGFGSIPLVLVALAVAMLLGTAAVVRGLEVHHTAMAGVGAALASVALVGEAGVVASALGVDAVWSWAVASAAAAVAGAALPFGGWSRAGAPAGPPAVAVRTPEQVVVPVAATVLLTAHVWALGSIEGYSPAPTTAAVTAALAVGVVALATIGARRHRSSATWWVWAVVAGVEALALLWFRLAEADVVTLEAYTLPVAVLLGASTWLAARSRPGGVGEASSWHLEGPGLAMAFGPTVVLALGDPGVARQVVGLGLGALLLGIGAVARRRAPVDVGAVTVVALGLQALLPYADQVPRWVSLGAVGAVLVLLGATFEQRRRDLRRARRLYSGLR